MTFDVQLNESNQELPVTFGQTQQVPVFAKVDQSYNPESTYAQSGIAVEEAITNAKNSGELKGEKGDKGDKGDDYVLTDADKQEIAGMVKPRTVTFTDGATLTIEDNTEYIAKTDITNLTIVYPNTPFICSLNFTLASEGDITITLPESKYIGGIPSFANGETWELNIKNGVVVGGLIE